MLASKKKNVNTVVTKELDEFVEMGHTISVSKEFKNYSETEMQNILKACLDKLKSDKVQRYVHIGYRKKINDDKTSNIEINNIEIRDYPVKYLNLFYFKIENIRMIKEFLLTIHKNDKYPDFFKFSEKQKKELENFNIDFKKLKKVNNKEFIKKFTNHFKETKHGFKLDNIDLHMNKTTEIFVCDVKEVFENIGIIYSFCVEFYKHLLSKQGFDNEVLLYQINDDTLSVICENRDVIIKLLSINPIETQKLTNFDKLGKFKTDELVDEILNKNALMYQFLDEKYLKNFEICKKVISLDSKTIPLVIQFGPLDASVYQDTIIEKLEQCKTTKGV